MIGKLETDIITSRPAFHCPSLILFSHERVSDKMSAPKCDCYCYCLPTWKQYSSYMNIDMQSY